MFAEDAVLRYTACYAACPTTDDASECRAGPTSPLSEKVIRMCSQELTSRKATWPRFRVPPLLGETLLGQVGRIVRGEYVSLAHVRIFCLQCTPCIHRRLQVQKPSAAFLPELHRTSPPSVDRSLDLRKRSSLYLSDSATQMSMG